MNNSSQQSLPNSAVEQALVAELSALEHMAFMYAGDPVDAEDLLQDTCLLALRFSDTFKEGSNLKAWLFRVMRNRHVSLLRRRRLERRVSETEEKHALKDWSIGEMGRRNMEFEGGMNTNMGLSDPIVRAMEGLRPEFRETVLMCDVEGLSYVEAARRSDRPVGTIMSRLHRGRRALRQKLGSRQQLEAA
ncbi:MAG: sigma-70 family RNA polymerase sigma factor [Proteobacteria bacterium]|nr:sigma-70 family RNA polymerase sigma factor [Pseudomonadota bacterium]